MHVSYYFLTNGIFLVMSKLYLCKSSMLWSVNQNLQLLQKSMMGKYIGLYLCVWLFNLYFTDSKFDIQKQDSNISLSVNIITDSYG